MISRLGLNTRLARYSRRQIGFAAGGALAVIILLFFIFGGIVAMSGAQAPEDIAKAIDHAAQKVAAGEAAE